jgi:hypothetical protein
VTVQIRDSDGTVRLSGDLLAAGGATGDVLTQQTDGTYAPDTPSGGSLVSCLLTRDANLDIHGAGNHAMNWDGLYDNTWDFNPLAAIPAGLGLTFTFNGTSGTITTTAAGIWAFSCALARTDDATWEGLYDNGVGRQAVWPGVSVASAPLLTSDVVALPSGAALPALISSSVGATANPYNITAQLSIVRLG